MARSTPDNEELGFLFKHIADSLSPDAAIHVIPPIHEANPQ